MSGPIGMAMGMLKGFLSVNISKVPEEKLREEMIKYGHMMLSWAGDD